jgi:hypothetical protein
MPVEASDNAVLAWNLRRAQTENVGCARLLLVRSAAVREAIARVAKQESREDRPEGRIAHIRTRSSFHVRSLGN